MGDPDLVWQVVLVGLVTVGFVATAILTWRDITKRDHDRQWIEDTMRSGFGGELPPLPASGTIQANPPPSSRWQRIRAWLAK